MITLQSYLGDSWVGGLAPHALLHDATTGLPCARTSSGGLDLHGALRYARTVGGPNLRQLTFAQRGELLAALSAAIHAERDALMEIGRINSGNTRSDAKFDIDGASGTLAFYAGLGKQLGDRTFLCDGEQIRFSRSSRFMGQHIWTPRQGVAIHINAFNFPAWNLCEKLAVALLAGVPVLAKPATSTAWLSVRIAELWTAQGLLPKGAFSLLAGPAGDLLDHVQSQDTIVFTGSGDTGRAIRSHARVLEAGVPVHVEADSLNAVVLGPDVEPGSDTFAMFVTDTVRELTQKTGQKCTAARRIVVPEALLGAVREALVERLADTVVGDPQLGATTLGPLATHKQQRDVLAGIAALEGVAETVWRGPEAPEQGYFVSPRLFLARGGVDADFVHDHEVFGPIATLLPGSGQAAEVIALVARGGGGLVCSVYSDDATWSREVLLGLAPWHGRIYWGSAKVADQGSGQGAVMPALVHGGPGKAGGGEELGGERGLHIYWQRTAIQGDTQLLRQILD